MNDIVYESELSYSTRDKLFRCIGITNNKFACRHTRHQRILMDMKHKSEIALLAKFWEIKETGGVPNINFDIVQQAMSYKPGSNACNLCPIEIFHILKAEDSQSVSNLNQREKMYSKCKHRARHNIKKFC